MAGVMRGVVGVASRMSRVSPVKTQVRTLLNPSLPVTPLTKAEVYVGGVIVQLGIFGPPFYFMSQISTYSKHHLRGDRL